MKPSLAKKVGKTAQEIEPLAKLDNNPDAGFRFVSIDRYYDSVAKVALANGLWWKLVEDGFDWEEDDEGKKVQNQTYNVCLIDLETGEEEFYSRMTISHPYQYAQTTGSSISYGDKAVMRALFKVVTGEPDADHFAKGKKKSSSASVEVKSPFKKESSQEPSDGQQAVEAVETKRRGRKPAAEKEVEPEADATPDPVEETDEKPWEGEYSDPQGEYSAMSAKLLKALARCKTGADLEQFRLDFDSDVKKLKTDSDVEDEPGGPERQKWAIAAKNVVASKFRELFDKFNEEAA